MSSSTSRILAFATLALLSFAVANGAEAAVIGSAFASFGRSSPVQTVQFGGVNCYYSDGWNGRGWYQCGDEFNDGFGWIGPVNTFGGSAIRRHHRQGVVVSHPRAPNPVYSRLEPPRRLGAGAAPAFHTFAGSSASRRFGAGGVRASPNLHAGVATLTPGFAGGGFHGGLGGGNFHHFHSAGIPHIGAPVSPGFAGGGGFHGLGGATGVHIGAPASPGFAGVGSFHAGGGFHGLGGATGVHIGSPASPSFAGVGTFHAGGGFHGFAGGGGAHIGAFASPGFAGGGFHGVGGGGVFQGGGAPMGLGGIGHR
jgi:hypothetical protein